MLEKLKQIDERYRKIEEDLTKEEIFSDPPAMSKLLKEQKDMAPVVETYREYIKAEETLAESEEMLSGKLDADFRELVQEEANEARKEMARLEHELRILLIPKDPDDDKNVIVEIRGGVGGEEAALFAAVLYRMYSMYAERKRWKTEVISLNETEIGGIKEISFSVEGAGAYSRLKFESGIHRVQRVPETEAGGRIHTSAASVAVLPEADEVDIEINPNDLQIDIGQQLQSKRAGNITGHQECPNSVHIEPKPCPNQRHI